MVIELEYHYGHYTETQLKLIWIPVYWEFFEPSSSSRRPEPIRATNELSSSQIESSYAQACSFILPSLDYYSSLVRLRYW